MLLGEELWGRMRPFNGRWKMPGRKTFFVRTVCFHGDFHGRGQESSEITLEIRFEPPFDRQSNSNFSHLPIDKIFLHRFYRRSSYFLISWKIPSLFSNPWITVTREFLYIRVYKKKGGRINNRKLNLIEIKNICYEFDFQFKKKYSRSGENLLI